MIDLFFWRTSCRECLDAIPQLTATAARLGAAPLALSTERPKVVDEFLARQPGGLPVATLCNARPTFEAYDARLPTFVLVGDDRRVLARSSGWAAGQPIFPEED